MRILYNSKDVQHKLPFGTLTEGQKCSISVHVPRSCATREVQLVFLWEDKAPCTSFPMERTDVTADYDVYSCTFTLDKSALYFYYFRITTANESFSLYREGYDQTNMEAGDLWQLSCVPADFHVPSDYFGSVMYQIFPDRFCAVGECDTSEKLKPFWIHENKYDVPAYLPGESGKVENCDFFGGNLQGILSKLDYLRELGVRVIYLNPIFKAWSNHRYDTADYHKIDEMLGTEADLAALCDAAHARGMRIILDGVFSHTGSNSRYFDKENVFGGGAYHCPDSPYRSWYEFAEYPHKYTSWWGIETLPCVREMDESYRRFIIDGEDSVIAHWLRVGVDGFRLDVADELPDAFIAALRARIKSIKPDALLVGEVWEDASNKVSYGQRRRYFTDGELDSVMNYPFRNAIMEYVLQNDNGTGLAQTVMTVAENYPREVVLALMNILSTHDTARILSLLSPEPVPADKQSRAGFQMSEHAMAGALTRLRVAAFLQFVLPGMPCIYYGDEIGMQGFGDPFSRGFFRWDLVEGNPIRAFFVRLATMRNEQEPLLYGDVSLTSDGCGRVTVERRYGDGFCRATVNMGAPMTLAPRGEIVFAERVQYGEREVTLDSCGFVLERIK